MKILQNLGQALLASVFLVSAVSASASLNERTDFRDETIYFVMTTRFYDGDASNNVCGWDRQNVQIANNDPDWRGDFKGLIDKLDYIKALGFTAVWITPVVQNASGTDFHGYHAMDFGNVDLRYESRKDWGAAQDVRFADLIDAVHARGMKIILDIVLNHTSNFGEARLAPLFSRSQDIRNQASATAAMRPNYDLLPARYNDLDDDAQYQARFPYLKNSDGTNKDSHNFWHHVGTGWNWDEPTRWWGQIAGDCVDLNTENPAVTDYLIACYGKFIEMGVDGFRIDTTGHIPRLTFNATFIPAFLALGEKYKDRRPDGCPFYMFGECCARYSDPTYRGQHNLSSYFYTWKSPDDLVARWDNDPTFWDSLYIPEGDDKGRYGNMILCEAEPNVARTSDNAFMAAGQWHEPDYSDASGFNIIDFPMHYNFNNAAAAVDIAKKGDRLYNDASFNVVYVDSHDYCPGPNDGTRFNGGSAQWAENLSLMFTFRGIPCIYYGSEVEFQKGKRVDAGGTDTPVKDSGRAYFGTYLEGKVTANGFGVYTADGNVARTLDSDLSRHLRRLNAIRAAVPALRKGQYTWDGCSAHGGWAFKRAYKDSYALVALNGGATFSGVPTGTYTDVVTGRIYTVTDGTVSVDAPTNKGQLRVLVRNFDGGKIGQDGPFIYDSTPAASSGPVTFTDPGATHYYTAADAVPDPAVVFEPAPGAFRSETLTIRAGLNTSTVSATFTIDDDADTRTLNPGETKSFTIGAGVDFGTDITVKWTATGKNGETCQGSAVYRKVDPNAAITVYVKSPVTPNLYVWNDAGTLNGAWPGKTMTNTVNIDGTDYFCQTFSDVENINIIFNHNGQQTGDITGITEDVYYVYDGGTVAYPVGNEPGNEPITIYFDNTSTSWNPVKAYYWGVSGAAGWPGPDMTHLGNNIWKISIPGIPTGVVFNNGSGIQSVDVTNVADGHIYVAAPASGKASITDGGVWSGHGGVDNITIDNPDLPDVYYNMQGIRVAEPTPGGIYLRLENGKATKIRIL